MDQTIERCTQCKITPVEHGTQICQHCENFKKINEEFNVKYPKRKQEIYSQIQACIQEIQKLEKENIDKVTSLILNTKTKIQELENSYRLFLENQDTQPGNIEQLNSEYIKFISPNPVLCSKCGKPIENYQFTIEDETIIHNFKCINN